MSLDLQALKSKFEGEDEKRYLEALKKVFHNQSNAIKILQKSNQAIIDAIRGEEEE